MDETQRTLILPKVSQVVQSSKERHQPAHDWSNIQECQTDQNIFLKDFCCSVGLTAKYPILMQRPEVQCDKIVVTAIAIVYTSAVLPTSPQQNVNFESYQTKTRLSTWIRSLLKFTKEKNTDLFWIFFSLRFSDVFFICLYLFDRFSSRNLCNISLKFWCYDSERTLKC